jgi:hypothetical protein
MFLLNCRPPRKLPRSQNVCCGSSIGCGYKLGIGYASRNSVRARLGVGRLSNLLHTGSPEVPGQLLVQLKAGVRKCVFTGEEDLAVHVHSLPSKALPRRGADNHCIRNP